MASTRPGTPRRTARGRRDSETTPALARARVARPALDLKRSAAAFVCRLGRAADAAEEVPDRWDEVRRAFADRTAEHQRARYGSGRRHLLRQLAPEMQNDLHVVTWVGQIASQKPQSVHAQIDSTMSGAARPACSACSAPRGQHVEAGLLERGHPRTHRPQPMQSAKLRSLTRSPADRRRRRD